MRREPHTQGFGQDLCNNSLWHLHVFPEPTTPKPAHMLLVAKIIRALPDRSSGICLLAHRLNSEARATTPAPLAARRNWLFFREKGQVRPLSDNSASDSCLTVTATAIDPAGQGCISREQSACACAVCSGGLLNRQHARQLHMETHPIFAQARSEVLAGHRAGARLDFLPLFWPSCWAAFNAADMIWKEPPHLRFLPPRRTCTYCRLFLPCLS